VSPYTPIRKDKPQLTHFPKEIGSTIHRAIGKATLTHRSGKISQRLTHFPKEMRISLLTHRLGKISQRVTHFLKEMRMLTHRLGKISQRLTHFLKEIRIRPSYSKTVRRVISVETLY